MSCADLPYDSERHEIIALVPMGVERILDIGCGSGRVGEALRLTRPDLETWAVEPHPHMAAAATGRYQHVVNAGWPEAADALPPKFFDLVMFNDVLEHLLDPAAALRATKPLLSDVGAVVASIPNVRHYSVLWPLLRSGEWTYRDEGVLDRTHLHFFTKKSMIGLFEKDGWQVISITGLNRRRKYEQGDSFLLKVLSHLSRRQSDDFFFLQYALMAKPIR